MSSVEVTIDPKTIEKMYQEVSTQATGKGTVVVPGFSDARFDRTNLEKEKLRINLFLSFLSDKRHQEAARDFRTECSNKSSPKRPNPMRLLVLMAAATGLVEIIGEERQLSSSGSFPNFRYMRGGK